MYAVTNEDLVLRALHRSASEAGRPGIAIPSIDLEAAGLMVGGRVPAAEALRRLVDAGRVVRVRRDLVVLPDATGLLDVDMVDVVHAIAPQPYLITGGAALDRAGLTDQYSFGLTVLVPAELSLIRYRGQTARFFKTAPANIWGWEPRPGPQIASPERAVIDALNHRRHGVSLIQVVGVLTRSCEQDPAFLDRLLAAVVRYGAGERGHGARSSARRVGFLVDRIFGSAAAAPYLELIGANRSPVLLRQGGPSEGAVDPTWRVVVNARLDPVLAR